MRILYLLPEFIIAWLRETWLVQIVVAAGRWWGSIIVGCAIWAGIDRWHGEIAVVN